MKWYGKWKFCFENEMKMRVVRGIEGEIGIEINKIGKGGWAVGGNEKFDFF